MRTPTLAAMFALAVSPAIAQTSTSPVTGARPGNEVGTGNSLPLSSSASNITGPGSTGAIAPRLPSPAGGNDAVPNQYLHDARRALLTGRTGEAQEALERAETRMLDRSVALNTTMAPIPDPMIAKVGDARRALAAGDRAGAVKIIDSVIGQ